MFFDILNNRYFWSFLLSGVLLGIFWVVPTVFGGNVAFAESNQEPSGMKCRVLEGRRICVVRIRQHSSYQQQEQSTDSTLRSQSSALPHSSQDHTNTTQKESLLDEEEKVSSEESSFDISYMERGGRSIIVLKSRRPEISSDSHYPPVHEEHSHPHGDFASYAQAQNGENIGDGDQHIGGDVLARVPPPHRTLGDSNRLGNTHCVVDVFVLQCFPVAGVPSQYRWHSYLKGQCIPASCDGYIAEHDHRALDIPSAPGTPIVSVWSGFVLFSGWLGNCGEAIVIEHVRVNRATLYCHLQSHSRLVTYGDVVEAGEQIASMGSTGYSTGSHLHFRIHDTARPSSLYKWGYALSEYEIIDMPAFQGINRGWFPGGRRSR